MFLYKQGKSVAISPHFAIIVILTFLMGYAIKYGNLAVAIFDIIVIGAYIIFLLFNWHKAKVFMGDTGSFFLGAVIALSAIATRS